MLFLLFHLGAERYALEAAQVAEVVPLLHIKPLPQAPPGVAGVFNHRGAAVPVIDLTALALGRPSAVRLSTRIVLVHYRDAQGRDRLLGVIAEKVTETVRREPGDFVDPGITNPATPYLGPVAADPHGMIQWVDIARLLPDSMREMLFQEASKP
ncbi:MAG: chemotaxis protein CheW [Verrucomicrobiota bacterium]